MTADPVSNIPYPLLSAAADFTATMKPPIDATGVLIGQLLRPASCHVVNNADIPIAANSRVNVTFGAELFDTTTTEMHSTSTTPERIYCRVAGRYTIDADFGLTMATGAAVVTVYLVKNGVDLKSWPFNPVAQGYWRLPLHYEISLAAGDYIHFSVATQATSSVGTLTAANSSYAIFRMTSL